MISLASAPSTLPIPCHHHLLPPALLLDLSTLDCVHFLFCLTSTLRQVTPETEPAQEVKT